MARIRTIKPEFWTSSKVVECSPIARLLFVGLWNFADDGGVLPRNAKQIKMLVFPGDDILLKDIEGMLQELETHGLVTSYVVEDKGLLYITGWKDHQRIDRPNYKYPGPLNPHDNYQFDEYSTNDRRMIDDRSPPDRNGVEGIGMEGIVPPTEVCAEQAPKPASPPAEPSEYVFPVTGKGTNATKTWVLPKAKLDEYREAYPGLDIDAQMRRARQWCRDNPLKRKTPGGMLAFLTKWLNKEQNNPGGSRGSPTPQKTNRPPGTYQGAAHDEGF